MLTNTLLFYILAAFLRIAHAAPLAGFFSAAVVFHINKKESDGSQTPGFGEKFYSLLSLPFYVTAAAFILPPIISGFAVGTVITSSIFDMIFFIIASAAGVGGALFMLRTGVQFLEKKKAKFTQTTALERNKRTDVREIQQHLPKEAVQFEPVKFMDEKKGVFIGMDESEKPVYIEI